MDRPTKRQLMEDTVTMSIADLSYVSGLGRTMISQLIKDGDLEVTRIGRRVLVHTDSVRRLLGVQEAA